MAREKQALLDWLDRRDPLARYLLIRGRLYDLFAAELAACTKPLLRETSMKRNELVLLEVISTRPSLSRGLASTIDATVVPPTQSRDLLATRSSAGKRAPPIASAQTPSSERTDSSDQRKRQSHKIWDCAVCVVVLFCANSLFCPIATTVSFVALKC